MAQVDGTPGVQKLSVKHTEIMNYMLVNPTHKLGDVARHFGLTQPWLSCIVHSEAFQAELATRKDQVFNGTVLPIKEKLTALAHQGLDRISERLEVMDDKVVASVVDNTLDRLGFGSKAPPPGAPGQGGTVNVNINLRAELEEARRLIGVVPATRPALEVMVDGEPAPLGIGRAEEVQVEGVALLRASSASVSLAAHPSPGPGVSARGEV